jgi:hypothetical protein
MVVGRGQEEGLTDVSRKAFHEEDCRIHFWIIKEMKQYTRARLSQLR